jgi:hypothetical protein
VRLYSASKKPVNKIGIPRELKIVYHKQKGCRMNGRASHLDLNGLQVKTLRTVRPPSLPA